MRTFLADLWDKLRTSLWFLPTVMAAVSVLLAFALVRAQKWVADDWMRETRWLATGDPDAARQILATIAGSIITVTGVIFSVTLVALSLASQQFGPRLLRNFMRDRSNQFVLGTFIGTFLYSLLVLRVVQGHEDETNIPYLAVSFAVGLAVVALAVLIYFIHHVVVSIQADTVVQNVSRELHETLDYLFPQRRDEVDTEDEQGNEEGQGQEGTRLPVVAPRAGYVRALDQAGLISIAEELDCIVHIHERPGKFVIPGMTIAELESSSSLVTGDVEHIIRRVRHHILIGDTRTAEQDIEFGIAQLVEVALRALSPSLNDPFTAMSCLDRLGQAISTLGQRVVPEKQRHVRGGKVRLLVDRPDFDGMVRLAFDQIRQNARTKPAVIIRMLDVIAAVVEQLREWDDCTGPLLAQARMAAKVDEQAVPEEYDREVIAERLAAVLQAAGG